MPTPLRKIDSYLPQAFITATRRGPEAIGLEAQAGPGPVKLPMLVRLQNPQQWQPPPDFETQATMGSIISGRGTLGDLEVLERDPNVLGVEASRQAGIAECATSVPFIKATPVHTHSSAEKGDGALVALIDSGIDVLHEAFRDDVSNSRILEIWDQRDNTGPAPNTLYRALKANYGTIHTAADISRYLASGSVPTPLGPPPAGGNDNRLHGTHVTSIAVGRKVGNFAGGVAPVAKILVVIPRIRTQPSDPFSIGYSSSHVEALDYIKEVARTHALPVVVNLSLGMNAGAHDGTSALEAAFDAFSGGGREPGFIVVKSAGNERGHYGHAKLALGPSSKDTLTWDSASNIPRIEDVFERWFKACDEFEFQLIAPPWGSPTAPQWDPPSAKASWANPRVSGTFPTSGNTYSLVYTRYHHDNGDSRLQLTISPGNALQIEPGQWTLEIETGMVRSSGEVHAWVERDNSRPVLFTNHQNEEITISIPGTARTVITIGAVNSAFPVQNTPSSSYGPTRDGRDKPDLVAPGTAILAAEAGTASGVTSLTGTSMAAPHVTGAITLLLSHRAKQKDVLPNAAQIQAALTQLTQKPSGHSAGHHFTLGHGYGVLDADAIFSAFD